MFIAGFFFICWRLSELTTLMVPLGILAWFIDGFVSNNMLTPTYILLPFIVTVLASIWVLNTLIRYSAAKRSGHFVAFVDLCFLGAFIASAYQLRHVSTASCSNFRRNAYFQTSLGPFGAYGVSSGDESRAGNPRRVCDLLKTCFAFMIMETVFFAGTSFMAYLAHDGKGDVVEKSVRTERRRSHSSRRGHSHSGRRSSSGRRQDYHV
ncbi:hypothetical protein AJ80_00266 [Polytolypa hystricis UAMH7299]|uniref:MARVEL domain-containing protein n=1 Tax=Polytolypa hystricis (strain UAMH7299) TaxID=1447883 RepID=A0A2B7Z3S4_POLH7|nr:hypothetical protein AJ80_00266 [Polytolypa hystricis UAMH7299]